MYEKSDTAELNMCRYYHTCIRNVSKCQFAFNNKGAVDTSVPTEWTKERLTEWFNFYTEKYNIEFLFKDYYRFGDYIIYLNDNVLCIEDGDFNRVDEITTTIYLDIPYITIGTMRLTNIASVITLEISNKKRRNIVSLCKKFESPKKAYIS